MTPPAQRVMKIRRDYNSWVATETLEDYALRFTPHGFRKWSEWRVANTAFGASSFLVLEAVGGTLLVNYGFINAFSAILAAGLLIFLIGTPISYYAARYGVDMDLLTRGAGFGYIGSTLTSLIYAFFTFIFFALEAAIMAYALELIDKLEFRVRSDCVLVNTQIYESRGIRTPTPVLDRLTDIDSKAFLHYRTGHQPTKLRGRITMTTLTVTARGQVTFRKDVLQHLGIRPGDKIDLDLLPDGRCVLKAARPAGTIVSFVGMLAGKTQKIATIEEINEATAQGWAGKK